MRELGTDECKAYLQQASVKPLLLDVREPWEYRIVHLEDTWLIPMRDIPQHADSLDPDQEIIIICHHGIRSRQVGLYLEMQGFTYLGQIHYILGWIRADSTVQNVIRSLRFRHFLFTFNLVCENVCRILAYG